MNHAYSRSRLPLKSACTGDPVRRLGNDLLVDRRNWYTMRFYVEVGRYLENDINYDNGSLMVGRS